MSGLCKYFEDGICPQCFGQKDAPPTDCEGLEEKCESYSHIMFLKEAKVSIEETK